jgi:Rieske Fe-S protein
LLLAVTRCREDVTPESAIADSQGDAVQPGGRVQLGQGLDDSGPPWHLEARSVVGDVEHRVSLVCPHLGGIVNWNDADDSWECPLDGSCFAPDGTLLEGPATRGLTAAQ